MFQLFDAIEYLHDNWVLHRDLKTSNILYNNRGELKVRPARCMLRQLLQQQVPVLQLSRVQPQESVSSVPRLWLM